MRRFSIRKMTPEKAVVWIVAAYSLAVVIASFQNWLLPLKQVKGAFYTQYNNYVIFKQSFFHLINNQNLYEWYLTEQWDLFKYSPSFALIFVLFAFLPDLVGLTIWNGANAFLIVVGVLKLPQLKLSSKNKVLLFVLVELLTSMQNAQSNGLIVGLIILGFVCLESNRPLVGILAIVSTVFIKIFGILALLLLLFYPNKVKLAFYTAISFIIWLLLPLLVISPAQLILQYQNWWALLVADHSDSLGLSVMGWLAAWFDLHWNKSVIVMTGALLLLAQFALAHRYKEFNYRLSMAASILVWMVIFNHKAESPTFIIAVVGAAIWYVAERRETIYAVLMAVLFVFTILSPTDVFPNYIQDNFFDPYVIKVVPCVLIWIALSYTIIFPGEGKKA